jgi:hypothetical protein
MNEIWLKSIAICSGTSHVINSTRPAHVEEIELIKSKSPSHQPYHRRVGGASADYTSRDGTPNRPASYIQCQSARSKGNDTRSRLAAIWSSRRDMSE